MSDDRATQISARLAAAHEQQWEWEVSSDRRWAVVTNGDASLVARCSDDEVADLIANAPSDLAWLLAERAELLRRVETAEKAGSYDNLVTMLKRAERERDEAQSELERIASHTRDACDQRDAAQEALAASEAKVARAYDEGETAAWNRHRPEWESKPNPYRTSAASCPRETPFKSYTEPTCSRPEGHAGGCLFNSHDGRTPLEVMPK